MRLRPLLVSIATLALAQPMIAQRAETRLDESQINSYAQLLAMTDTRRLDTTLVDRLLATRSPALRAAAALAIGQLGTERGMAGGGEIRPHLPDNDSHTAASNADAPGVVCGS